MNPISHLHGAHVVHAHHGEGIIVRVWNYPMQPACRSGQRCEVKYESLHYPLECDSAALTVIPKEMA